MIFKPCVKYLLLCACSCLVQIEWVYECELLPYIFESVVT